VTPRALLTQLSAGRIAMGATLLAAPQIVTGIWLGADGRRPAVRVLGRGFGARDLVLGAGTLGAMRSRQGVRTWVLAGLVADATDLAATLAARDRLPRTSGPLLIALAGGALVVGAAALASGDDSSPVPA
jgi:hypothetical protein